MTVYVLEKLLIGGGDLSLTRFPGHTYSVGEGPTARYNGKATPLL